MTVKSDGDKQGTSLSEAVTGCIENEYAHILSELARYDGNVFRLITLFGVLSTLAFVAGDRPQTQWVLSVAPFVSLAIIQFLIANNYAYTSRLHYIREFETRLGQIDSQAAPSFYSRHDRKHFFSLHLWESILLPFNGVVFFAVIIILGVGAAASWRSYAILRSSLPTWGLISYYLALLVSVILCSLSCAWSFWKLSRESRSS